MILHGNPGGMHFSRAVPGRDWAHRGQLKARRHQKMLEVFSDASYGANADHRSIQGLVVCYAGVPIAWQCGAWHIQQQRRSSLPTANHWLLGKPRKLCYVLSGGRASTATPLIEQIYGDNAAAIGLAHGVTTSSWRTRHLRIRARVLNKRSSERFQHQPWRPLETTTSEGHRNGGQWMYETSSMTSCCPVCGRSWPTKDEP